MGLVCTCNQATGMPGWSRGRLAVAFSLTDGPFEPILWSFYSAQPSLQHGRHKGMLQWVGSEGNVRAPKFILYWQHRARRGRGKHSTGNHCLCFNNYSFECDRFPISGKYTVIWGRESHLSRHLKAPYSSVFNEIANYMTNNMYWHFN